MSDEKRPAWYVSVKEGGRVGLVLGPFYTEEECRKYAYHDPADGGSPKHGQLVAATCERCPTAWFYSWGMVKLANDERKGAMNVLFGRVFHT